MYYPVQIPYVLNKEFSTSIQYSEEIIPKLKDFVICFWEMHSNTTENKTVENIIITDGCIDLVADCEKKQIGFAGFNQTNFRYKINLPFAIVTKDNLTLMFQERENLIEEYPVLKTAKTQPSATLYITVDNFEALYEELKRKQAILCDIHKTFYGTDEFAIKDNNGYVLTFTKEK